MTKLEIVHAVPDLRRKAGGIAGMIPALSVALRKQKIESRFISLAQDSEFCLADKTKLIDPVEIVYAPAVREAVQIARDAGSRVICHSHGLWHPLNHALAREARRTGLPLVISVHGMLMPWARRNRKLRKDLAWHIYQRYDLLRADAIHVTSEAERGIVDNLIRNRNTVVVPFGVDIPKTKLKCGDHSDARILLFLGRLHPVKNLFGLLDAFAQANPTNWKLVIAGPDESGHRRELAAKIGTLKLDDRIELADPAYGIDKENLLSRVDALVLPSFSENFGAVVAEALATGLPVIASKGTPWNAINTKGCGWWVSPNVSDLANAITDLSSKSTNELAEMGARGRSYAESELSWKTAAERMSTLYRSVDKL